MSKNRLDPILHHASSQQQDLAQRLSQTLRSLRDAEAQLEQLLQYRSEYGTVQPGGSSFSVENLHNQQLFINQVNKAIEQQELVIQQLKGQVQQQQVFWQQAKTRSDAIGDLIDKQSLKQQQREETREQKENDERSGRISMPRPGSH